MLVGDAVLESARTGRWVAVEHAGGRALDGDGGAAAARSLRPNQNTAEVPAR
jgi:hypothetical protein